MKREIESKTKTESNRKKEIKWDMAKREKKKEVENG